LATNILRNIKNVENLTIGLEPITKGIQVEEILKVMARFHLKVLVVKQLLIVKIQQRNYLVVI